MVNNIGEPNSAMLAREVGLSQGTTYKYLHGYMPKSRYYYDKIATYFGVSVEYLEQDTILTKEFEHVGVGEITGLSDDSINVLKRNKEYDLTNLVNDVIENDNLQDFLINMSIKHDILTLLEEVDTQYEQVMELQKKFKKPYQKMESIYKDCKRWAESIDNASKRIIKAPKIYFMDTRKVDQKITTIK